MLLSEIKLASLEPTAVWPNATVPTGAVDELSVDVRPGSVTRFLARTTPAVHDARARPRGWTHACRRLTRTFPRHRTSEQRFCVVAFVMLTPAFFVSSRVEGLSACLGPTSACSVCCSRPNW